MVGAEELLLEKKKLLAKELILLRRDGVSGSEASEDAYEDGKEKLSSKLEYSEVAEAGLRSSSSTSGRDEVGSEVEIGGAARS